MNYICGYLNPYTIFEEEKLAKLQKINVDRQFTIHNFNKIIKKGVKISPKAALSHNVYIGSGSKLELGVKITKSIIGNNCLLNKSATLNHCVVLDGCSLGENAHF